MTAHRVRFAEPLHAASGGIPGPAGAALALLGLENRLGANGFSEPASDVWGGIAFYRDRESAEAAIDASETISGCEQAIETWHGLLCPLTHRGETAWFGALEEAKRFQPAGAGADPGGRLVVLTSAGYNHLPPEKMKDDIPRRVDFLANVERVLAWYRSLPTNRAAAYFQRHSVGGTDGVTISVWDSDAAMAEAAYKPGIHRTQLDRYKTERTADRSSFTRARLLREKGTWNGAPLI